MGCMVYGAVWLYAHTALYGAVWCCMAVWRQEGGGTMRGTCMAPYNCMVNCMALLLYGAPMRHRQAVTHLCHTLKQNYRTFTHMQTLVCAWKSAWASLKGSASGMACDMSRRATV